MSRTIALRFTALTIALSLAIVFFSPAMAQDAVPTTMGIKLGSFSIKPLDYEPLGSDPDEPLTYKGEPIKLSYRIENGDVDLSVGLAFFVDGAIQPHEVIATSQTAESVQPGEGERAMSIHSLKAGEWVEFTIRFTPVLGKKGDVLSFRRATLFNPHYLPADETGSMGINGDAHPADFGQIQFEVDAPAQLATQQIALETTELSEHIAKIDDLKAMPELPSYLMNDGSGEPYMPPRVTAVDGKIKGQIQLWDAADAAYRLTFFVNNDPIPNGETDNVILSVADDGLATYPFELELPKGLPKLNTFYATIMPVGDGYQVYPEAGHKFSSVVLINPEAK